MKKLLLAFLCFTLTGHACEVYQPDKFNFTTSVIDRSFFPYKNNGDKSFSPFFQVTNCGALSNKNNFLMISFGPQNQELSDRIKAYDIANQTRNSGCKISNSPFKNEINYLLRKRYLNEKWKAIKSCYRIVVKDEGDQSLQFPEKQPGCEYAVNSQNEMEFNGGYCFFSPKEKSSYKISFKLKDDCLDYEGMRKLDIKVSDFQAVLNFYSAGDSSGSSLDLIAIKSFPLRFSVSPNRDLFLNSDVFGFFTPQFPANFYLPDTHLGTPEIMRSRNGKVVIRLPLWADNNCPETCRNGYCQALCDYSQPLSGEIALSEISSKGKILDSGLNWFQGGVILPRYQGEISGTTHEVPEEKFQVGKTYHIVMTFNDPKFDFQSFKQENQKKIQQSAMALPSIGSSAIPTIPSIEVIGTPPLIPEIIQIGDINFSTRINSAFDILFDSFEDFFKYKFWPPHFKEICHEGCTPIRNEYLVLSLDFLVKNINEFGDYEIEVLRISRKSTLLEAYNKFNPQMPKISCARRPSSNRGK